MSDQVDDKKVAPESEQVNDASKEKDESVISDLLHGHPKKAWEDHKKHHHHDAKAAPPAPAASDSATQTPPKATDAKPTFTLPKIEFGGAPVLDTAEKYREAEAVKNMAADRPDLSGLIDAKAMYGVDKVEYKDDKSKEFGVYKTLDGKKIFCPKGYITHNVDDEGKDIPGYMATVYDKAQADTMERKNLSDALMPEALKKDLTTSGSIARAKWLNEKEAELDGTAPEKKAPGKPDEKSGKHSTDSKTHTAEPEKKGGTTPEAGKKESKDGDKSEANKPETVKPEATKSTDKHAPELAAADAVKTLGADGKNLDQFMAEYNKTMEAHKGDHKFINDYTWAVNKKMERAGVTGDVLKNYVKENWDLDKSHTTVTKQSIEDRKDDPHYKTAADQMILGKLLNNYDTIKDSAKEDWWGWVNKGDMSTQDLDAYAKKGEKDHSDATTKQDAAKSIGDAFSGNDAQKKFDNLLGDSEGKDWLGWGQKKVLTKDAVTQYLALNGDSVPEEKQELLRTILKNWDEISKQTWNSFGNIYLEDLKDFAKKNKA